MQNTFLRKEKNRTEQLLDAMATLAEDRKLMDEAAAALHKREALQAELQGLCSQLDKIQKQLLRINILQLGEA